MYHSADIGVIGGSGFYELPGGAEEKRIVIDTKYGKPSDAITLIYYHNMTIAFLPRHGRKHTMSPAEVNYRANIDAFAQLGVKALISLNCVGSLRVDYKPGDYVITDQYINMTSGRLDTYYRSPQVEHLSSADPYDPKLRQYALEEARLLGYTVHDGGTTMVINGPRFSTRAESAMFRQFADVINMTQYPEAYLAQEKSLPLVNVAYVTDYDAGIPGDPSIPPVTAESVKAVFEENKRKMCKLVFNMADRIGRK